MKSETSLTVIVTAYNEEQNILPCLQQLESFLEAHLNNYQIIMVDDGSTDRTFELVNANVLIKNLKVLKMNGNQGVGASIKTALPYVELDWFCWFPSDLEFLPTELLKPIALCSHNDIVITHAANSKVIRSDFRYYLSALFNKILNWSFSKNIKYYNGITLYRKILISNLEIESNRFFFHAELLLKCLGKTSKFAEVEIILTPRSNGKSSAIRFKVLKDVMYCYLKNVWKLRIKSREYINS
jgi:glycosyltransferase involved in cell wall biosynthesis